MAAAWKGGGAGQRLDALERRFSGYHTEVTAESLREFIAQFDPGDRSLGLRILEKVNYFSNERATGETGRLIRILGEKVPVEGEGVYFSTMSTSAGGSSDRMIGTVRHVLNMNPSRFDRKFVHLEAVPGLASGPGADVVFVDDIIGTGCTAIRLWEYIARRVRGGIRCHIGAVAGHAYGIERVREGADLEVSCAVVMRDSERALHDANADFSPAEKNAIRRYCRRAMPNRRYSFGYGGASSLAVFYTNAPNTAIALLHARSRRWPAPAFPRL